MIDKVALIQAAVRFGRTVGAAAVSAAVLGIGDLIVDLQLGPTWGPIALLILTALLNALGKLLRGPDVPAAEARVSGRTYGLDRRARSKAFFLPF
jgi:hypothetical protein